MLTLYPAIQPYVTHNLSVDNIHTLYVEESGNKHGIPIVSIHGGPGSCCYPDNRRFFDPEKYRIILFDQRGCGKSTPHAELQNNTTRFLIEDLELIRKHLGIESWILFGGSWGSTLALLYAESYPNRVISMILRGICLCRKQNLSWLYDNKHGAANIYPDYWQEFVSAIPKYKQNNTISAYYKILTSNNEIARMAAAKAWAKWNAACSTLDPCPTIEQLNNPHLALSLARIECHYFINKCFIEENTILNNIEKIQHIKGIIIHGRYDMMCPLNNAYDLHKAWTNSNLIIIRNAGHSSREPGILHELIYATNSLALNR